MAEAVWNGFLRLSLVSCPITLTSATSDAQRVKLDLLSARTGNPVAEQFVDAKTGDVVAKEALVKGFEFASGRYVTVTEDELAKLGSGVGNIIDLEQFVPRDQIDHLYVDAAYYLRPEGQLASDTVHALRLAMRRSGRVALGHIKIGEQERPALIEPHRAGLMMSTLRTQEELVSAEFSERADNDIPGEMIEIAEAIIARRSGEFDPKQLRDRYQDDLRKLVEQKAGNAPVAPAEPRRPPAASRPPAANRSAPPAVTAPPPPPPQPEPPPVAVAPPPAPEPPPEPEPTPAAAAPAPEPQPVVTAPEPPPPLPEPAAAMAEAPPPAPEPEPVAVVAEPPPPAPEPEPAAAAGRNCQPRRPNPNRLPWRMKRRRRPSPNRPAQRGRRMSAPKFCCTSWGSATADTSSRVGPAILAAGARSRP